MLRFVKSGELWDTMLENMPEKFFDIEVPQEYR